MKIIHLKTRLGYLICLTVHTMPKQIGNFITGIPINVSKSQVSLAKEMALPKRKLLGTWEIVRNQGTSKQLMRLPLEESAVHFDSPKRLEVYQETLDRVEARGLGFSELQSYWALPFPEFSIVGDVCTVKDKHNRQLFDTIHVATANPAWLFSMTALSDKLTRLNLTSFFDRTQDSGRAGGSWRTRSLPRLKLSPLGGKFSSVIAVHDEVSNAMVLVEPNDGSVISVRLEEPESWLSPVKEAVRKSFSGGQPQQPQMQPYFRMSNAFATDNKLVFYAVGGNTVQLLDLSVPVSHKVELPFKIHSLHPLNEDQYLVSSGTTLDAENPGQSSMYLLRRDSTSDPMPSILTPVHQNFNENEPVITGVDAVESKGLSDLGLKCALKETVSSPNTLASGPDSYATLFMGFPELEYSANEVYAWPKNYRSTPSSSSNTTSFQKQTNDPGIMMSY